MRTCSWSWMGSTIVFAVKRSSGLFAMQRCQPSGWCASKTFPSYSSITDPSSGSTYNIQYDIFTVGAGYLDVQAALLATDVAPTSLNAKSPAAGRLLCQKLVLSPISSTFFPETTDCGASSVTSTSVFA